MSNERIRRRLEKKSKTRGTKLPFFDFALANKNYRKTRPPLCGHGKGGEAMIIKDEYNDD